MTTMTPEQRKAIVHMIGHCHQQQDRWHVEAKRQWDAYEATGDRAALEAWDDACRNRAQEWDLLARLEATRAAMTAPAKRTCLACGWRGAERDDVAGEWWCRCGWVVVDGAGTAARS